jgi:uncharacterized protein
MTLKRWILAVLTLVAIVFIGNDLWNSFNQPQFQSRLELYQTNLLLHVNEWKPENSDPNFAVTRKAIAGNDPLKTAIEQYQEAEESNRKSLDKLQLESQAKSAAQPTTVRLRGNVRKLENLAAELDLRLGILQAEQGNVNTALETWQKVAVSDDSTNSPFANTAQVLSGLWSTPPKLLPDAEAQIQRGLEGWFRYQALERLYQLQQRQDELADLQAAEQVVAEEAFTKLVLVTSIPGLGLFLGGSLLLFWVGRWLFQRLRAKQVATELATWHVPWDAETIVQVLVVGFVFVGQLVIGQFLLPLTLGVLGINPALLGTRSQAFLVLAGYLLLAAGGLGVLYFSVKPFFPLPKDWFRVDLRSNWLGWGIAGYCIAWPIVLIVSQLNQLIWQGQGGSNPILPIALEGRDPVALTVFVITASVAAPIFEEIMFRGFLLPSLTRYVPIWGAIALSGFIFAIAHLSLSEVLPLAALGMVLGYVYVRSRNLLASMLLHSLWNGGTLLSLFILGSGSS